MKLRDIVTATDKQLLATLQQELKRFGYKPKKEAEYLYAKGKLPVMVVAHVDTVHTRQCTTESICVSADGDIWMSPYGIGGDDRCGIYIILQLLERGLRPSVLFTDGEEKGGIGAKAFCRTTRSLPGVNFLVEFDRKGHEDAVFYDCGNDAFQTHIKKFGFKDAIGSYSDISDIMDEFDIAGVNLSSGYNNAHTVGEFIQMSVMLSVIDKAERILKDSVNQKRFDYQEIKYAGYGYLSYGSHTRYPAYKGSQQWLPAVKGPAKDPACQMCGAENVDTYDCGADTLLCEGCANQMGLVICEGCFTMQECCDYVLDGEDVCLCQYCEREFMLCSYCNSLTRNMEGVCDACADTLDEGDKYEHNIQALSVVR